ncbi:TPA_asm: hypothetical protein [ssRNA phage SRR7473382_4]|uniref:Uncharacterized protein n=1 Tax=ssRNA phage SRR7473382_4 TaxID=2786629 RepID=A0A8S5L3S1_9VIRU|nr:hypothetical protein QIM92_gp4 [ssRNA phage SRR7473382_4]DAD52336.1 TPA_asm: hypothetical protein [ssRNA phage SRR7473382_4]
MSRETLCTVAGIILIVALLLSGKIKSEAELASIFMKGLHDVLLEKVETVGSGHSTARE